ncbi:MAG: trigger factor [Trueperaceae bacterium]|nr:trigger factor [Trueperaceae bacterium]
MHVQLVDKQAVAATFTVTIPAAEVDAAFEQVLSQLARQVKVPGFRPGKAPRGVLVQRVGADVLAGEVREVLVDDHYPKAVRELELLPVHAHFHGDDPVAGADFTFEVRADLYPQFDLPDLDAITIDTPIPTLEETQVEATIARLRDEHATLVPADRPVEAGDVVFVETLGEGGGSSMPIDLSRTEANLVEQLLGKRAGDEVTLELGPDPTDREGDADDDSAGDDAPADDAPADEAPDADANGGADADGASAGAAESPDGGAPSDAARRRLAVRIDDVKVKELPEADDAFAQTLGFEAWSDALAEIRSGLTKQLEREAESAQRDELVDKLVGATETELPKFLVNRRKVGLLEELGEDLRERQHTTLEVYLAALDEHGRRAKFDAELQEAAERAVKRDLVLEALLERRGASISDAEFDVAVRHMAQRDRKDPRRFRDEMGEEWLRNYRFLLERDRAVRVLVAEKTGRGASGAAPEDSAPDAERAAD